MKFPAVSCLNYFENFGDIPHFGNGISYFCRVLCRIENNGEVRIGLKRNFVIFVFVCSNRQYDYMKNLISGCSYQETLTYEALEQ